METKGVFMDNGEKTSDGGYRTSIKKIIDNEVKKVIENEIQLAAKELIDEQREGIRQILEEYRFIIHEIIQEEKKAMAEKAEELKRSILKLGLEGDE